MPLKSYRVHHTYCHVLIYSVVDSLHSKTKYNVCVCVSSIHAKLLSLKSRWWIRFHWTINVLCILNCNTYWDRRTEREREIKMRQSCEEAYRHVSIEKFYDDWGVFTHCTSILLRVNDITSTFCAWIFQCNFVWSWWFKSIGMHK